MTKAGDNMTNEEQDQFAGMLNTLISGDYALPELHDALDLICPMLAQLADIEFDEKTQRYLPISFLCSSGCGHIGRRANDAWGCAMCGKYGMCRSCMEKHIKSSEQCRVLFEIKNANTLEDPRCSCGQKLAPDDLAHGQLCIQCRTTP